MTRMWGVAVGFAAALMLVGVVAAHDEPKKPDKDTRKLAAECVTSLTLVESYTAMVPQDLADFCVATAIAIRDADYDPVGP